MGSREGGDSCQPSGRSDLQLPLHHNAAASEPGLSEEGGEEKGVELREIETEEKKEEEK